jgi:phosphopantothenoylcysteine decarboxylase/phosphopantothenate--cysteine ligase
VQFSDVTFRFQVMTASDHSTEFFGTRVALGVTGGIAAYKAIEVLRGLQRAGCDVRVCMTRHACEFVQPLTFRSLSGSYVIVDDYAPDNPDPIAHITFSQTIDLFVIAPATANTIAKLANGVADDFLTSTYLACTAPVLVAPAMNTTMWHHPATQRNLDKLRGDGVHVVEPDEGEMACGTIGPGRLSEPERIVTAALEILRGADTKGQDAKAFVRETGRSDLIGEHILITTGATREPLDPVRFISNRSSGRMGFALAQAARNRGAQVTVIAAATTVLPPSGAHVTNVVTAEEMQTAVMKAAPGATVFIAAAAVSDYRPAQISRSKIKKSAPRLEVTLERTADILAEVSKSRRDGQIVVGFAAETDDVLASARQKLVDKSLDMIVANDVSQEGAGFDSENNAVSIVLRDTQEPIDLPLMTKLEAAHRVLDEVAKLRNRQLASKTASPK